MPFDGNGNFSPASPEYPAVTGTVIDATKWNTIVADIAAGLTACLTRSGQGAMTAALPMGGNRLTNLAAAAALLDGVNFNDIQSGRARNLSGVAGSNTVTATALYMTAYTAGQSFTFLPAASNTGAVTLNINAIGAKSIKRNGVDLAASDLKIGQEATVYYDGTNFQLDWASGTVSGRAFTSPSSVAFSATPTFDAALSNVFYLAALTANVTTFTINNPVDGQTINIRFVQDGTGSRTVTPPATVKVTGAVDPTASRASWLTLTYVLSATRWEGAWLAVGA